MEFINLEGHTYFIMNILPNIPERLYGFSSDGKETRKVEGYSKDGFPIISSFYGNEFTPKFIALIKLTLTSLSDENLKSYITNYDKKCIENIKSNYNENRTVITQVHFFQVDNDIKILDNMPIEIK